MKKFIVSLLLCIGIVISAIGCVRDDPITDQWTHNLYPDSNGSYVIGSNGSPYAEGHFTKLYSAFAYLTNIFATTGNFTNINVTNNGSFGNVTAGYFYGNGSNLTSLPATGNFTNINVTNNGSFGNTVTTSNLSVSNVAVVGNVSPAALLTLASGNISIGLAPLKFTAGPLLTNPVAGAMEFDGTGIYLTPTNHRRFISLASDSLIATVNATTVATTNLWIGVLNANELKINRVLNIKGCGLYSTHDDNDQPTITIYTGATPLVSLTIPKKQVTNASWSFEVYFTIRTIGGNGTLSTHGEIEGAAGTTYSTVESVAVNTTAISDITVKCTWDTAQAGNEVKLTQAWLATAD